MYDNSNRVGAGTYDLESIAIHEMTEAMGRMLLAGSTVSNVGDGYTLLDLLHYSGAGTRDITANNSGYFSPDGGATDLGDFNADPSGDAGDWASSDGSDAFNAFTVSGGVDPVTGDDLREMDALGWDRATNVAPTVGRGSSKLILNISEDYYLGDAQYTISADGNQVGGVLSASALHGSGQDDTVTVLGDWGPGQHQVAIDFLNDAYGGSPSKDRNLYVDGLSYGGLAVPGETAALFSAGTQSLAFGEAAPSAATQTVTSAAAITSLAPPHDFNSVLGKAFNLWVPSEEASPYKFQIKTLPTSITALLPDGATPVTVGQVLTAAQAGGIRFKWSGGAISGQLTISQIAPNGSSTELGYQLLI